MRVVTAAMFGCLLLIPVANEVLAKDRAHSINNAQELSERVNLVLSKKECTLISENSEHAESQLRMQFRFRCEGVVEEASALLNELREVDGLLVEDIVTYAGVNPKTNRPSVDVRFDAVAVTGVEG